jgi:hypothetical protein
MNKRIYRPDVMPNITFVQRFEVEFFFGRAGGGGGVGWGWCETGSCYAAQAQAYQELTI